MKSKNIAKIIFLSLICAIMIVANFFFSYQTSANNTKNGDIDLTNPIANTIKVEAIARENSSVFNGNEFLWRDLKGFKISFDSSKIDEGKEPPKVEDGTYTLSFSVGYYDGTIDSKPDNDEFVIYENVKKYTFDNYNNFPSFTFNVDDFLTDDFDITNSDGEIETTQISTQGWGVYQFYIDLNGAQSVSEYYYVEPDYLDKNVEIDISYEIASATTSMHNAYLFSIIDTDETFKYVNKNNFVWYVYGKDFADNNYCLTKSDAENKEEFADFGKWLYEDNAVERTGETFYFDDNSHSGTWNVYCVYEGKSTDGTFIEIKSTENTVTTGKLIEKSAILWVILAIGVVGVIVVIISISVGKKKEKVW